MNIRKFLKYLSITFCILLFGKLTELNILFPRFNQSYANSFQNTYIGKEKELNKILLEITDLIKQNQNEKVNPNKLSNYTGMLEKRGMAVFLYYNDSLTYWSDNAVLIATKYSKSGIDSSFIKLRNAWYMPCVKKIKNTTIVGLILIKQVYQYENKFLENKFQKDFNFPATVKISRQPLPNSHKIQNINKRVIFSLVFDSSAYHALYQTYIPSSCYFIVIVLILWFIYKHISQIQNNRIRNMIVVLATILLPAIKLLMQQYQYPNVFYSLDLFKPQYFATSDLLPSLGDMLIWTVVIFFVTFIFYKEFIFSKLEQIKPTKQWLINLCLIIHLLLVLLFFCLVFYFIQSIILNSTISFEINKLLLFDFYSIVGYLMIMLLFTAYAFHFDKMLKLYSNKVTLKNFLIIMTLTNLGGMLLLSLTGYTFHLESFIFIALFATTLSLVRYRYRSSYKYSVLILIVALFALYTVYIVTEFSTIKNNNQKNVLITNLATEHDPIAEYILRDINTKLTTDSVLEDLLQKDNSNLSKSITNYLKDKYFNAYFSKYKLQNITICSPEDSVELLSESLIQEKEHCYSFFKLMITEKGTKISGTDFYYVDNMNGTINYMGYIEFNPPIIKQQTRLYFELQSKLISEELGYPELLLDNRYNFRTKLKEFSYAKYYNHQLITQFGDDSYNLTSSVFDNTSSVYSTIKLDNQSHLLYRPSPESLIVLSSNSVTFLDFLISFSYTFLVYFLILTLIMMIINLPFFKRSFQSNFKNNIQFSMMSVLFLSLIFIGGGTLYYNIHQYYNKHTDIISEKLQSIYMELSSKLGTINNIKSYSKSNPSENLNEILINLSNIFYIDINLYDTKGDLIATSRPEVFDKGLISTKINPEAYRSLTTEMKPEFIHNEKIGKLRYLSAYTPFKNNNNKLIALLNLPYFTHQEELMREISTMAVAAINIYVLLLLLTFLIAVVIANRITQPLRIIQTKFSEIKLGQKYERIEYASHDEIGGLVKEYNRMVTELEISIEMLAKSERESAWREMAKQIAHEINNPLTPMKLSVQHLHRAWMDKSEHFEEYFNRISKTLIDEIDNLSSIATEFSNFAKMPTAINQQVNLIVKIENAVNLFSNDNVDFHLNLNNNIETMVFADKEQLSRVFINLIKNAIQSVSKGVKPIINIDIIKDKFFVTVRIQDNGKGIPEEMQTKLFRPNFTTKTSGMGLGLAIVKNITESAGGSISYETTIGKGTTFIVTLPLYLNASLD